MSQLLAPRDRSACQQLGDLPGQSKRDPASMQAPASVRPPDECYCIGQRLKDVPDIAIEVVVTSGGIEKLPVYAGLGVREVWFWEQDAFHLHALRASGYEAIGASEILPGLDLDAVATFMRMQDQHEAVKAFRDWLRGIRR